ncbi:MAG: dihydrofolate reductase [bacterium]
MTGLPPPSLIVAMARNRVIGRGNAMPWHLPSELQRFKRITLGHHIVMGRNTFESIGRLLPGRTSVIVTRNPAYAVEGAIVVHSLDEAVRACAGDEEPFVIGGAQLFAQALPLARRIHLTTIDAEIDGDVLMPPFDRAAFRASGQERVEAGPGQSLAYDFERLDRIADAPVA